MKIIHKILGASSSLNRRPWRISSALICTAILVLACFVYFPFGKSTESDLGYSPPARVLDDTRGAIGEIALNLPTAYQEALIPVFDQLVRQLPASIRVRVACSDEACAQQVISRWRPIFLNQQRRVDVIVTQLKLTPWARDRRIARQGEHGYPAPGLIPPILAWDGTDRRDEIKLPTILNILELAPESEHLPFWLDGGNLVVDDSNAFVGSNVISVNAEIAGRKEIQKNLTRLLGKQVVFLGNSKGQVPWNHLDMYVTPLPGKKVLVGSPSLARNLIRRQNLLPQNFVTPEVDTAKNQLYDSVANQFAQLGYEVIRMPLLPNYDEQWVLTYNNVIMDYRNGVQTVFLPTYGMPSLDAFARKVFLDLGFDVKSIDVSAIYQEGGTIRCIANVSQRLAESEVRREEQKISKGHFRIHRPVSWAVQEVE